MANKCPFCGAFPVDTTQLWDDAIKRGLIEAGKIQDLEAELTRLRGLLGEAVALLDDLVEDELEYEQDESEHFGRCNFCGGKGLERESIKHTANCAVFFAQAFLAKAKKEGV